jgi:hypothetical protein
MTISNSDREFVRSRARFVCEYCGVSEAESGGLLTIDHYYPQAKGGSDHPDNLVYCCYRCNLYKSDYWPAPPSELPLWNPRVEPFSLHFLELESGKLLALTPTGEHTLTLLWLNRPPLIQNRLRKRREAEERRLLAWYKEIVAMTDQVDNRDIALATQQKFLQEEMRRILNRLSELKEK